jgi:hypothetical protein
MNGDGDKGSSSNDDDDAGEGVGIVSRNGSNIDQSFNEEAEFCSGFELIG